MQNTVDKSNFKDVVKNYPKQFAKALDFAKDVKIEGQFENVIVCGLGGSALPVDMVISYLKSKNINFPISVCRNYTLPVEANEKSLIIASSFSGSTEETISCLNEALAKNYKVVGIARGKDILEICQSKNIPYIQYPDDGPTFQPRCASGYIFTSIVTILSKIKVLENIENDLTNLGKFLESINIEQEKAGQELAPKLKNNIPLIYTTEFYRDSIARIFKIKLNENAKTQSFFNYFPELNHNEMVGFTNLVGKYFIIILQDPNDHDRNKKRMNIFKNLLEQKGISVEIILMKGNSVLEKIFASSLLADWTSYYLALAYNQDPTPVNMVEEFKELMKK
ncbi:MAG: bifunctional phosphoglucose/phosphomannose isomerase [Patescibacteria group bacterium]|jgi:glucose/mannose-6-phosphate isomerase